MTTIKYKEFEKALKTLGIVIRLDKHRVKEKYLKLSKQYHPDNIDGGNIEKFQEINEAYHLLMEYINNFRFEFSKEEFGKQFPIDEDNHKDWLTSGGI